MPTLFHVEVGYGNWHWQKLDVVLPRELAADAVRHERDQIRRSDDARQDEKILNSQGDAVLQTVLDQGSLDDAVAGAGRRDNDMAGRGESARRYAAADSRMIATDHTNVMFAEESLLVEARLKIRQIAHCQIHLPTLERLARGLRRHG
jgi:hypothetical protein